MVTAPAPNQHPLWLVMWHSPSTARVTIRGERLKNSRQGLGWGSLEVIVKGTNVLLWDG